MSIDKFEPDIYDMNWLPASNVLTLAFVEQMNEKGFIRTFQYKVVLSPDSPRPASLQLLATISRKRATREPIKFYCLTRGGMFVRATEKPSCLRCQLAPVHVPQAYSGPAHKVIHHHVSHVISLKGKMRFWLGLQDG